MTGIHFQKLSSNLIATMSQALSKTTRGLPLQELESHYPKLKAALETYQHSEYGAYYRSLGNARMECALLRFGRATHLSGTIITDTSTSEIPDNYKKQPLYQPRYTAALGVLIQKPSKVRLAYHTLLTGQQKPQSATDVLSRRKNIVQALKKGQLQATVPRVFGYGLPRQEQVNESIIDYTKDAIAAFVIPKSSWQDNDINYASQSQKLNANFAKGLELGRLTAQLGYSTMKIGELPILTFNGYGFENLQVDQAQWQAIFEQINSLSENPLVGRALTEPNNGAHAQATGLQCAAVEAQSLEQDYDAHELKHVLGSWSSIPINVGRFLLRLDKE